MIEWPLESNEAKNNLLEVLNSRRWWSREGLFVKRFQKDLEKFLNIRHCHLCTNGSHALKIALKVLNIGFLDYVIVPSITFIATALAVLDVGAIPIFADIDLSTACISIESAKKLKNKYKNKIKVIIPVHFGGHMCNMKKLCEWAKSENINIIEDCAQAIGSEYDHKKAGTFGDIGCFSFQNSKNISSGEGGAVVTNSDDFSSKINKYIDYNNDKKYEGKEEE